MARKAYCLVPSSWTAEDLARHTCDDRSHIHLSRSQLWTLECDGLIEWIHEPVNRRDKGIVRLRRVLPLRGLSCRVGAALAEAVKQNREWAQVMLADICLEPAAQVPE